MQEKLGSEDGGEMKNFGYYYVLNLVVSDIVL
jgi:hypothetical protein